MERKFYEVPELIFIDIVVDIGFINSVPGSSEGTGEDEWY